MLGDDIKNEKDLEKALARLDEIWSARPGDADWEERRSLVDRIEAYEDQNIKISPPNPVDAILFRMEQEGLRNKDLVPFIGSAPKVSEVLTGKRNLSKEMIRRLHEGLGIPLNSLLGVADNVPDGFVQVDWVLPSEVVWSATHSAKESGMTDEDWVARTLTMTITATRDENNSTTMTMTMTDKQPETQETIASIVAFPKKVA